MPRIVPLQKQALRHKLPRILRLRSILAVNRMKQHSQVPIPTRIRAGITGSGPRRAMVPPFRRPAEHCPRRWGGSGVSSAAYASQSFTQPAPPPQHLRRYRQPPGVEQSSDAPSDAQRRRNLGNAVRDAQSYRDVFKHALLQPQLQAVTKDRFTDIAAICSRYEDTRLNVRMLHRVLQLLLTPLVGNATAHSMCGLSVQPTVAVSVRDITNLYLSLEQLGGQLGAFITDGTFGDDAYDEYIRCSPKYHDILVDLIAGARLMNRPNCPSFGYS